jgi:hydrogenase-1 operon protein HyaF
MKAGFWVAPEGAEDAMTIMPLDLDAPESGPASGAVPFLATASGEALARRCARAAELLPQIAAALERQTASAPGRLFDLTDLGAEDRELIAQVLGQGEVFGLVALPDGIIAQIQEATMAGLWRVRFQNADGALVADYLETASIPEIVKRAAIVNMRDVEVGTPPSGAMNVMPVLVEIAERSAAHEPGAPSHIINFSLLPMSPDDMAHLQAQLGAGAVRLSSRGYGTSRVLSTAVRNVWSVQYLNSMETVILDTLEIGDPPAAICAADEDFRDSAERLREIYDAYFT